MKTNRYKNLPAKEQRVIVKRIIDGDNQLLYDFLVDNIELIADAANSVLGDDYYIEDLLHDIYIKCITEVNKFRFKSKFTTWLYEVVKNHCINEIKRKITQSTDIIMHKLTLDEKIKLLDMYRAEPYKYFDGKSKLRLISERNNIEQVSYDTVPYLKNSIYNPIIWVIREDRKRVLWSIIYSFDKKKYNIFKMYYINGISLIKIANLIDESYDNVRQLISRGRKEIQALFNVYHINYDDI
jgi:RNA polymerase sigma factor (sigma-70 family)